MVIMKIHSIASFAFIFFLALYSSVSSAEPTAPRANPFFAMDTSYRQRGLPREQQLDLVKQLGFAGVTEDVRTSAQTKTQVGEIESRGLKLFAIYAPAQVTPAGDITVSHDLSFVYRYATRVLCLNKRNICVGTPQETLTAEVLKNLYGPTFSYYHHDHEDGRHGDGRSASSQ